MPGLSAELENLPGCHGGLFLVDQPMSAVLWVNLVVNDFAEILSPSDLSACKCLHLCDGSGSRGKCLHCCNSSSRSNRS